MASHDPHVDLNRPRSRVLRDPGFLRLWAAETISHLGSSVTNLALPVVAITLLDATPLQIAILNLADFLPFLLIGLVAGVVVDRLGEGSLNLLADCQRAAAVAGTLRASRSEAESRDGTPAAGAS